MKALRLYAGPRALAHLRRQRLAPDDVRVVPAAAGGPKGLILGPLDRYLFGDWLPRSDQPIDLVGASIGAWRMATACLADPQAAFVAFEHSYIEQHYEIPHGRRRLSASEISQQFSARIADFFKSRQHEVLGQRRYRLHLLAARGRHLLAREHAWRTPLGYAGAFLCNAAHRRALGWWLERAVFSSPGAALPFGTQDLPTRQTALDAANFLPALQASCAIPFVLQSVAHIPGAPEGAYWDGGITDYHLHLDYAHGAPNPGRPGVVLYPHFQRAVVPGWLDKRLPWRHRTSHLLDDMLLLAPDPDWVRRRLPGGRLPDRTDFTRYGNDLASRVRAWQAAVLASQELAEEFANWVERADPGVVQPL